jgi:5-methyltetrahydrofolate--homocysteine methyltransferase
MELLQQISEHLQKGDTTKVGELTAMAIEQKLDTKTILDDGLIAGMTVVGKKFKVHDIFLPDVLLAAKAMYAGLDLLKPLMLKEGIPTIGKVVIGTVQGDLHDIGKNLVAMMLKGAGFEVIDVGIDVTPEKFVEQVKATGTNLVGISALLTTTMPAMEKTIKALKEAGIDAKIMIGGAPITQ